MCLGGTELRRGAARPGRAARTDEVGGEDVGGPYWTLGKHHSVEQRFAGLFGSNTWFPAMLGLMGASALLYSVNGCRIDAPQRLRADGFDPVQQWGHHGPKNSHCVTHGVNFSVASLLLIVRSRDWARAVPDAELRVRANSYRTNVRGAGVLVRRVRPWSAPVGRWSVC